MPGSGYNAHNTLTPVRDISPSPRTDAELLQAYKATGDQQTLASLYLRYTDMVYGTCLKYLKDAESAKDAVMHIYQELISKTAVHEVDQFKSWLYVLTKNHCLMQLRSAKKMVTVEFQPAIMQSEEFAHLDAVLEKEQEFKRLEQCMEQLPEAQHTAIRLFYLEQKCYNEIVDITGMDWGKVRSLIQNGRRNLKNCMEQHG